MTLTALHVTVFAVLRRMEPEAMQSLIKACPNLKVLDLEGCKSRTSSENVFFKR